MYEDAGRVILLSDGPAAAALSMLQRVGFEDCDVARRRLTEICPDDVCRDILARCLPMLLAALSEAATPDGSLVNFERYLQSVPNKSQALEFLADNPRAVEILVKLFVGSQFLTEILLRNPVFLDELTNHKRLAEFKSRQQFVAEAEEAVLTPAGSLDEKLDALRRRHHWELLRIGACDTFGLFDLKSVTVQLALLADAVVQLCLNLLAEEQGISAAGFAVIAFGKLGGEELNYSSDIDLVFIADSDASRFWRLGQNLIKSLMESTGEGFFYRVDMRLRPWGRSGALVNTLDAHVDYLKKHGMDWEKQALLKARAIAGDRDVGREFLQRVEPLIFSTPANAVRQNIREMKAKIESSLQRQGRNWGEVKAGYGSIRDVEFVTQGLQLIHGRENPGVRSINTMDGLIRLADFGFLHADEYRHLTSGYLFLRTIEHALQLMHHKQTHSLPESPRELAYLARRLDFADAEHFLRYYEQHCTAIRAIYTKYIENSGDAGSEDARGSERIPDHRQWMAPSYAEEFSEDEIAHHAQLLKKLSADNLLEVEAVPLSNGRWLLTIVGYNHTGELSLICGLLFVYGYNIFDGNVFTAEQVSADSPAPRGTAAGTGAAGRLSRKFVNVFTLGPPLDVVPPDVWPRYQRDLLELVQIVRDGRPHEASGRLAKRVAGALRDDPHDLSALFPAEI
ncbi:MAG: glutamine synthetase adenylyltransferase, partial [Planctomycetes bacterium]|nr:glutamine synthetase adenylyltransferase [Planctomycetota bacterium]